MVSTVPVDASVIIILRFTVCRAPLLLIRAFQTPSIVRPCTSGIKAIVSCAFTTIHKQVNNAVNITLIMVLVYLVMQRGGRIKSAIVEIGRRILQVLPAICRKGKTPPFE